MTLMNKIILSIGLISLTAFSHELPSALAKAHAAGVGALAMEGGVAGEHARLLVDRNIVPADDGSAPTVDAAGGDTPIDNVVPAGGGAVTDVDC